MALAYNSQTFRDARGVLEQLSKERKITKQDVIDVSDSFGISPKDFKNANKDFNFKLNGRVSAKIQKYYTEGSMDWHMDEKVTNGKGHLGEDVYRVLSMSVVLNDNFSGGGVKIKSPDNVELDYNGPVGTAIVFPSTWLHKVESITEGTRYVLTAWAYGTL